MHCGMLGPYVGLSTNSPDLPQAVAWQSGDAIAIRHRNRSPWLH
jgi:hypothetical protein